MPVADVEHGERLIDPNDPPALQALRHRPGHAPRACRHVENQLIAFEHEHFGQLLRQIRANLGDPPIELRRMLRIVEPGLLPVPMTVIMPVAVPMTVFVIVCIPVTSFVTFMPFMVMVRVVVVMLMSVLVGMLVPMTVLVFVMMPASVIVFSFLCHLRVPF